MDTSYAVAFEQLPCNILKRIANNLTDSELKRLATLCRRLNKFVRKTYKWSRVVVYAQRFDETVFLCPSGRSAIRTDELRIVFASCPNKNSGLQKVVNAAMQRCSEYKTLRILASHEIDAEFASQHGEVDFFYLRSFIKRHLACAAFELPFCPSLHVFDSRLYPHIIKLSNYASAVQLTNVWPSDSLLSDKISLDTFQLRAESSDLLLLGECNTAVLYKFLQRTYSRIILSGWKANGTLLGLLPAAHVHALSEAHVVEPLVGVFEPRKAMHIGLILAQCMKILEWNSTMVIYLPIFNDMWDAFVTIDPRFFIQMVRAFTRIRWCLSAAFVNWLFKGRPRSPTIHYTLSTLIALSGYSRPVFRDERAGYTVRELNDDELLMILYKANDTSRVNEIPM